MEFQKTEYELKTQSEFYCYLIRNVQLVLNLYVILQYIKEHYI